MKEPKVKDVLKLLEGATWKVDRCDEKTLKTTVGPYKFSMMDFGTESGYTQMSIRDENNLLIYILSGNEIGELYDRVSDRDRFAELNALRVNFNDFLNSRLGE